MGWDVLFSRSGTICCMFSFPCAKGSAPLRLSIHQNAEAAIQQNTLGILVLSSRLARVESITLDTVPYLLIYSQIIKRV